MGNQGKREGGKWKSGTRDVAEGGGVKTLLFIRGIIYQPESRWNIVQDVPRIHY